ncbi:MAG TPA: O-antigen ligase family protein [Thermoanaerobaculia bacterium]|nr:O-antigen ligase family protein [Thermoanaerobaculia bacterium]
MNDGGIIRHFGTGIAVLLALLLLWAPLPFASVTRWGSAVVQTAAFAALAFAALTARSRDLRAVAAPAAALTAIAVLGALQSLSWPRPLASVLSPRHAGLMAAVAAGRSPLSPLSLAPDASGRAALTWAAVAAVLVASAVASRRRDRRRWLGAAILAAALFQVLYGAGRWIVRATEIWGVSVPGDPTRLRGSFVNPDHLALYLEISLAIAFAWGWWALRRARLELSAERRLLLAAPPVVVWLILFLGLAFTGSRGGLAAAVFAAGAQGLLLAGAARRKGLAPVGALAVLAGVGIVAAVNLQAGFGRLAATSAYEVTWNARREVYAATWELWQGFPWLGTGLGAFRDSLALTQPAELPGTWWHAHSDWLELLATVGLLGAIAFLLGLVPLAVRLFKGWTADRRSEDRAAILAALGALVSLAIHESIDFGLTMPACAVTLAALLGAAAMACGTEGGPDLNATAARLPLGPAVPPKPPRSPRGGRRRRKGGGR